MTRWTTTDGDTVEVYFSKAPPCLRAECNTEHVEYRYRVTAPNGEIVEQGSESYTRKAAAVQAAQRHHPVVEAES